MKLPFFKRRPLLSDVDIKKAMDDLRKLRLEVAVSEVEVELRRSQANVRVLRPKGLEE